MTTYKKERFISFAVMLSPVLILIQQIMIRVFNMGDESTTYRVLLTAIPMSIAIWLCFKSKPRRFVISYSIVVALLVFQYMMFPENRSYLLYDSTRFTLPMVLSSAVCLSCVSNIRIVEKSLYVVSWITAILTVFYIFTFFSGAMIIIDEYSMSLSYALLLPIVSFYKHGKAIDYLWMAFLLMVAVVLGSRGAVAVFLLFWVYDILSRKKKLILPMVILAGITLAALPLITRKLESIGLVSRTLNMILEGQITQDTGRFEIYGTVIGELNRFPITGIGLWGDRRILNHLWSHNIFVEILADWGYLIGSLFILGFLVFLFLEYQKVKRLYKNEFMMYSCVLLLPFMVSGSYLITQSFGIYLGILFTLNNSVKHARIAHL